jgi:hypothetical protein
MEEFLVARLADANRKDHKYCFVVLCELASLEPLIVTRVFSTIDFVFILLYLNADGNACKDRYSLAIDLNDFTPIKALNHIRPFFALAIEILQSERVDVANPIFDFCEKCFGQDCDSLDTLRRIALGEFYFFVVKMLKMLASNSMYNVGEHLQRVRVLIIKSVALISHSLELRKKIVELVVVGLDMGLFEQSQYSNLLELVFDQPDGHSLKNFLDDSKNELGLERLYAAFNSFEGMIFSHSHRYH